LLGAEALIIKWVRTSAETDREMTFLRSAATLLAAFAALALPAAAHAADCPEQDSSQVFQPWLDLAWYVPAPDGGLEDNGAGWSLSGGAAVQAGNESYDVGGADHTRSLRLPPGSSATTPPMCIGIEHPTVRFFARNTGFLLSTLKVAVVFRGLDGESTSLPVGVVLAGDDWAPTLPLPVLANLLALLGDQEVSFRFTPVGGAWSIDDVYVDPYRKS
jgi:hypothetical protein